MDELAGMAIEKAGELILNSATKKIAEYKEKKEWEKLFINTNEFLLKCVDTCNYLLI